MRVGRPADARRSHATLPRTMSGSQSDGVVTSRMTVISRSKRAAAVASSSARGGCAAIDARDARPAAAPSARGPAAVALARAGSVAELDAGAAEAEIADAHVLRGAVARLQRGAELGAASRVGAKVVADHHGELKNTGDGRSAPARTQDNAAAPTSLACRCTISPKTPTYLRPNPKEKVTCAHVYALAPSPRAGRTRGRGARSLHGPGHA